MPDDRRTCRYLRDNGTVCRRPAIAVVLNGDLCMHHLKPFAVHLRQLPRAGEMPKTRRARQQFVGGEVVYYVRIGTQVKIGTTSDLRRRISHFYGDVELLAAEPGSYALEKMRHRQFRHLRLTRTEMFERAPDLDAFIARIAKEQGDYALGPTERPAPQHGTAQ